jgi:multimeric flavodoxin WrbA
MKVVAISGSPRKGMGTEQVIDAALDGARSKGADTRLFRAEDLEITGCAGCMACWGPNADGFCVKKDDMREVHRALYDADAIILGSPVYMFQMTGQLKTVIDRFMPMLKSDYTNRLGGKPTLTVFTQGQPDPMTFDAYFSGTERMLGFLGFAVKARVTGTGLGKGVVPDAGLLEAAFKAGAALVN